MKTKAAVLYETKKPLHIEDLTIPELAQGQVLVKVVYSGICHSQLNEILGLKGEDKFLPHTLGHEGSGIVEQTGPGVTKVRPGDHVVLTWIKGKGLDVPFTTYLSSSGARVNSGAISTLMNRAVISENRLVKISKDMSLSEAALLGCAVPTGVGVIRNTLRVKPKDTIVILGIGGIGMSAILGAKLVGCKNIIAVDVVDWKLDIAKKLQATCVLNTKKQDIQEAVKQKYNGRGVDFVVEAAGAQETMDIGLKLIHNKGTVAIAGNLAPGKRISIDPFDLIKGKKIIGTWGGETRPDIDIPFYVKKCISGKLKLKKLISHKFKLEDVNQAFDMLRKGNVLRALIKL